MFGLKQQSRYFILLFSIAFFEKCGQHCIIKDYSSTHAQIPFPFYKYRCLLLSQISKFSSISLFHSLNATPIYFNIYYWEIPYTLFDKLIHQKDEIPRDSSSSKYPLVYVRQRVSNYINTEVRFKKFRCGECWQKSNDLLQYNYSSVFVLPIFGGYFFSTVFLSQKASEY